MITIKNLSKIYETDGKKTEALKDINIEIKDGDIFGIMGLSGAGKSSLLRCINMLERPTKGEVLINNINMGELNSCDLRNMRKKIGMIFQHFNLLMNSTVYDNIAFPMKLTDKKNSEIKSRVEELLKVVELEDKKNAYPSQLSGGQKQRVGIARALANNPDILLSDEATSALDPSTTESILGLLKNINKKYGITIIIITHEMQVIKKICRNVAVLEDGVIVECGNVFDIFSNPKTAISKKFLKDMISEYPVDVLRDRKPNEKILKVTFTGDSAEKPFISQIVKKYNVDANIIGGKIETIQDTKFGSLIIRITGDELNLNSAVNYLYENKLGIEVL